MKKPITALYYGGFKPPTKGHFKIAQELSKGKFQGEEFNYPDFTFRDPQYEVSKVIIFIGPADRGGIGLETSKAIWDIYSKHLTSNIEIKTDNESVINQVKNYLKDNLQQHFYIVRGVRNEEDKAALKQIEAFKNFNNATGLAVYSSDPEVSGTALRNLLSQNKIEQAKGLLPDELSEEEKDKVIELIQKDIKPIKKESLLSKKIATQVEGVFNAWFDEDTPVKDPLKEGSGGTPIAPMSAIKSSDRNKLDTIYHRLRNQIGDEFYTIIFNQDHIRIQLKGSGLNETLESESFDFTPHIASILEYMIDEGMNILPIPEVKLVRDEHNAKELFGKTAHYNPVEKEIVLYVEGRHPKDVLRSFAHEMIHHKQNLENRLHNISTTNTNEDDNLLELEKEAYLEGNITFRNWEDGIKNEKSDEVLMEGRYDEITNRVSGTIFNKWKKDIEAGQTQSIFYSSFSSDDSSQPSKKNIKDPISFDVEAALTLVTGSKELTIDGGASYSPIAEFDDLIRVQFEIDPELLPKFYEKISMNLKDVIRHEIEHLTHGNSDNYNKNKTYFDRIEKKFVPFEDDSLLRDLIDNGLLRPYKYFELPKEVDAMIQGMYFRAKKEKRPFADVVREYLDSQKGVTEEEKEEVLELWRKRLPMLGINQPLEEAQQETKFIVYCDMDGVLCNFDKRFQSLEDSKGMTPKQFEDQGGNIYPIIGKEGEKFWSEMDWMPNGKKLWDNIKKYNPIILTSPFRPNDPSIEDKNEPSRKGKITWCEKNLGISEDRIKFAGKKKRLDLPKPKFKYAKANTILIDDTDANIDPFNAKGGIGLLYFDSNVDEVLEKINKLQTGK